MLLFIPLSLALEYIFHAPSALVFGTSVNATAMPMDPTDETKVPHYFGPNPNWALSPLRIPNVEVRSMSARIAHEQALFSSGDRRVAPVIEAMARMNG